MGGIASVHKNRDSGEAETSAAAEPIASTVSAEEADHSNMVDGAKDDFDAVGEQQFGSLRMKDPDAWKGNSSPRPRSALKHGSSTLSHDSDASSMVERTPSGRRMPRKVSFQVTGLGPPPGVGEGDGHATKRIKGSEEFSMRFLVERFYSRVTAEESLRPFFDGVDMHKLQTQQEALMLLVFGGNELLEDELPGLSANLRLIHLHLLFEGLNLQHWQLFADRFGQTLDELSQIPDDVRQRAKAYMATTQQFFRPIEPEEWPPKVVYRGWTKKSCPFHTSFKRAPDSDAEAAAAGSADAGAASGDSDPFNFDLPSAAAAAAAAAPCSVTEAGGATADMTMTPILELEGSEGADTVGPPQEDEGREAD